MALDKIWVLVDRTDDKPKPVSLELLTKAHELGGTVEGVTWGDADAAGGRGRRLRRHRPAHRRRPRPGSARAGRWPRPWPPRSQPATPRRHPGAPDLRRPGHRRPPVGPDRPAGADQHRRRRGERRSARHRARHLRWYRDPQGPVHRREPPGSSSSGPSRSPPSRRAAAPAAVDSWEVPALGAEGAARVLSSHVEESEGPKLDEAAIVVSGGRGLGEAAGYKMIEELAKLLGGARRRLPSHRRRRMGALLPPGGPDRARRSSRPSTSRPASPVPPSTWSG